VLQGGRSTVTGGLRPATVKSEILPTQKILPTGIEPVTFSSGGCGNVVVSAENKALTASTAERCTKRCTETADRADELARLVALVARLPGTDTERAGLLARAIELLGK